MEGARVVVGVAVTDDDALYQNRRDSSVLEVGDRERGRINHDSDTVYPDHEAGGRAVRVES